MELNFGNRWTRLMPTEQVPYDGGMLMAASVPRPKVINCIALKKTIAWWEINVNQGMVPLGIYSYQTSFQWWKSIILWIILSLRNSWNHVLQYLEESHRETQDKLNRIQTSIQSLMLQKHQTMGPMKMMRGSPSRDLYLVVLVLALCQVVLWLYWKKWSLKFLNLYLITLKYVCATP